MSADTAATTNILPNTDPNIIVLESQDGARYPVERNVATQSHLIRGYVAMQDPDVPVASSFPLGNVSSETLAIIIKWAEHYKEKEKARIEKGDDDDDAIDVAQSPRGKNDPLHHKDATLSAWDAAFFEDLTQKQLFSVLQVTKLFQFSFTSTTISENNKPCKKGGQLHQHAGAYGCML